ncbi:MAG: response regulator [Bacteroidia bacterium]
MHHKKILLVDDDSDDQFFFMDSLKEITDDVQCTIANNGLEAINFLKKITDLPSLIFLDLNMPVMNGFDCLKHLKTEKEFNEIPVIIFTTSSDPLDIKKSKELGAAMFFTKTADLRILKTRLTNILNNNFSNYIL